jgi:2-polyprenyl-3-methyl-5-hydroxy-6-metoxy-1,4-benzoquinol methylase
MSDAERNEYYEKGFFNPKKVIRSEHRLKEILNIVSEQKGMLLDIGCGSGEITLLIKQAMNPKEVYGIDISDQAIALACPKGIKAFKVDISSSKFPFSDGFFDVIVAGEVVEHLFDPDFFFDEVFRILKPQGVFILTTPNLAAWYNRIALLFGFQPAVSPSLWFPEVGKPFKKSFEKSNSGGSESHIRFFTKSALKQLLCIHGFRILRIKGSLYGQPEVKKVFPQTMYYFNHFFGNFSSFAVDLIFVVSKP